MPKTTISTYGSYNINGYKVEVKKIYSEDLKIENKQKEVPLFEKYTKKKGLKTRSLDQGIER